MECVLQAVTHLLTLCRDCWTPSRTTWLVHGPQPFTLSTMLMGLNVISPVNHVLQELRCGHMHGIIVLAYQPDKAIKKERKKSPPPPSYTKMTQTNMYMYVCVYTPVHVRSTRVCTGTCTMYIYTMKLCVCVCVCVCVCMCMCVCMCVCVKELFIYLQKQYGLGTQSRMFFLSRSDSRINFSSDSMHTMFFQCSRFMTCHVWVTTCLGCTALRVQPECDPVL